MNSIGIKGMSCQHCVASVTEALKKIEGIKNVRVDLEKAEATYEGTVEENIVKEAIAAIGFETV